MLLKTKIIHTQIKKLFLILGLSSLDGTIAIAALSGLFIPMNAFSNALLFIAGPASIVTAALFEGSTQERIISALFAGIVATIIVMAAAGFGPIVLKSFNLEVIKIFGAIAVGCIAIMIAGVKIPDKIPLVIILVGIIGGILLR
jgi:hypothetical protein